MANFRSKPFTWNGQEFPINRGHQRLATDAGGVLLLSIDTRFQSIGVTKDWRPRRTCAQGPRANRTFPINRRHQGLATIPNVESIFRSQF